MDLGRSELLLLLAMADNCGEELLCYARVDTLAVYARMSERTAQRTLKELEDLGKISRKDRPSRTTLYQLLIPDDFGYQTGTPKRRPKGDKTSGSKGDILTGSNGATERHPTQSNCRPTGDKMAPDSSLNPSLHKPSDARTRAGPGPSPARAREPLPQLDIAALNRAVVELGLPERTPDEQLPMYQRRIGDAQRKLRYLEGRAIALHVTRRFPDEPLDRFEARVNTAETDALARQAAEYSYKGGGAEHEEARG